MKRRQSDEKISKDISQGCDTLERRKKRCNDDDDDK